MAEWDARPWSVFIWIIATVVWLCGFVTPFSMFGNRKSTIIAFGGNVQPEVPGVEPEAVRFGLWGKISDENSFMIGVQVIACLALVFLVAVGIGYALLYFFKNNHLVQIITFITQLLAAILTMAAIGLFRWNTDQMGEGFWMMATAGGMFFINALVLIFLPLMEHDMPKWVLPEDEVPLRKKPVGENV